MKRVMTTAVVAVALLAFAGAPASAATKHTRHHTTCKQIKEAIDGGKAAEDVEKDMHVTAAYVKKCTTPTAKKTAAPSEKKS